MHGARVAGHVYDDVQRAIVLQDVEVVSGGVQEEYGRAGVGQLQPRRCRRGYDAHDALAVRHCTARHTLVR
eukprot:3935350-Rhodomonas_salina.1